MITPAPEGYTLDTQYEDMLRRILANGDVKPNRTGIDTIGVFGERLRYDLSWGFPLITTKLVHLRSVVAELLWFLRGDSNVRWLQEQGVSIWDEWADPEGELGPVYGVAWRSWPDGKGGSIDQLADVVDRLRTNPNDRRMIVTAWNPANVDECGLPPCHLLFQFYVSADRRLSCQVYQRSCDSFLGVPFNIASYALLTHMVAREVGLDVGELIWIGGDTHIYLNHMEQVNEQLSRKPYPFPELVLTGPSLFNYTVDDVHILGYEHHPAIKGEVAV